MTHQNSHDHEICSLLIPNLLFSLPNLACFPIPSPSVQRAFCFILPGGPFSSSTEHVWRGIFFFLLYLHVDNPGQCSCALWVPVTSRSHIRFMGFYVALLKIDGLRIRQASQHNMQPNVLKSQYDYHLPIRILLAFLEQSYSQY
jgi:hypothetical protein